MNARIAPGAEVDEKATVGDGTSVWGTAHIREDAVVGRDCTIGRGVYIGPGVTVGDNCKVQNHALLYEPAVVEEGVFIGPSAVLTNDPHPRAVTPAGTPKGPHDWTPVGVTLRHGASVGARAVCVAPVTVGRWALVAAGSVVTRNVPDFALVAGAPARRVKWVGRAGVPLEDEGDGCFRCPSTGERYTERDSDTLVPESDTLVPEGAEALHDGLPHD